MTEMPKDIAPEAKANLVVQENFIAILDKGYQSREFSNA